MINYSSYQLKHFLILAILCLIFNHSLAQTIQVGSGSYTTQFPGVDQAGRNSFPSGTPFTIDNASSKPVPTNDWWSAQIKNQHADNLFNYPYTLKSINTGLVVSYMPWGVIDDQLPVIVGVTDLNSSSARVSDFSDWTVTMDWRNSDHNFQATSGIGMPFLYFSKTDSDEARIVVNEGTVTIDEELIIIENAHNQADFAIYAPLGSSWSKNGNVYTSDLNGKNYWSMAFLPLSGVNVNAVANEYKKHAYVFPVNTSTTWHYDQAQSTLRTEFEIESEIKEGIDSTVLIGLLPHHWNNLSADSPAPEGYSYQTVRGEMKMLDGNEFSVENKFYGILPTLPFLGQYSEDFNLLELNDKIKLLENEGLASWTDSYNQGQEMNRLIQTARIAELIGDTIALNKIHTTVKNRLEDWLSFEAGEVAFLFYYNSTWSALLGYPAGHGQDNNINDHHFHWGYFIHAASFVEQFEPGWSDEWGEMINHLVRDAANLNRNDDMYPFLRNFSPYAGHCWANGFASFPQGNDQESTSESMQFNSSLIHWGAITGNDEIRDLGIYLYTTEQTAIEEYWFDVYERNFSDNHPYSLVSRVWGNSYDNGTFWTNDIEASYGIELYPIHGGSLYLGQNIDYVQKLWTEITQNTGILTNDSNVNLWHDVMWSYLAFIDPQKALELYDSYPERSLKFGITDAQTYHWLHAMNVLGQVETSIHSSHSTATVFNKNGDLTYVAQNYSNEPMDVIYSDGYILQVPTRSLVTSKDLSITGSLTSSFDKAYIGGSVLLNIETFGGLPDSIIVYDNGIEAGRIMQTPFEIKQSDLSLGIHKFYAKIYSGNSTNFTNTTPVQVGEQKSYQIAAYEIPGSFQAAHFDIYEGGIGQNISYNDISPSNQGDIRLDEWVDSFDDNNEGESVGWISNGEWLEYSVRVMESGYYNLNVRYASGNNGGGGPMNIESDGIILKEDIQFGPTGAWDSWTTKTITDIPLKAGEQIIRLYFNEGEFNLGRLSFEYDSPLDYSQPIADAGPDMLVILPQNFTSLDGSASIDPDGSQLNFSWTQVYGPSVLEFSDLNDSQSEIFGLEEGVYLLQLKVDNGEFQDYDDIYIISSFEENYPPEVFVSSPLDNSEFYEGTLIEIDAVANDLGGFVQSVEFFVDDQSIGLDSEAPFNIEWTTTIGNHTIKALATDNGGSESFSEIISINVLETPRIEGKWKMLAEPFSLGVGPQIGDLNWWNCNAACIAERACYFDDEYIFYSDGRFSNVQGNESWIESWQDGTSEGCREPVAPHDGSNSATWSLNGNNLTINGLGAYLGLAKVYNGGELNSPNNAQSQITYPVELNSTTDTMVIDINFGPGFWHFVLVKDQSTSTNEIIEQKPMVYPNPTSDQLYFVLPFKDSEISIYNITGQLMTNVLAPLQQHTVNISGLKAGVYFVEIRNKDQVHLLRIIKE